ncbi:MAG: winged helix DNA-binding domain-containing protein [Chloroflexi bacterium]|nr:winged helix DNA-binding domain-containing protein [Chloroflexota bacterium]MCC6892947.1 YcaQ family DNA glycosylase [Anaerolineae bacterium]
MTELSQAAVRGLVIAAQGLQQSPKPGKATPKSVQDIIRQMHVLQIDTISVVARSPYLVLWSRLGDYDPRWLEKLLEQGSLFEYWSHAACFLPIEDFEYYRLAMLARGGEEGNWQRWLNEHRHVADTVLNHVRDNGAVRSSEFERTDGQKGSWWNWKAEKIALEYLLDAGELMIKKRHNFQRIYDLRERVLPNWDDANMATEERRHDYFVLNTVKALGVTKAEWIADYFRLKQADVRVSLKRLEKNDQLRQLKVEGWDVLAYYHVDNETLVQSAAKGKIPQSKTTLLSPFDPIVWDRKRALALYNFDYRIECYTPAPKRIYGYFTLPILYKNQVIGRLDPKAHRKEGLFEVKALHLEPGVMVDDELVAALKTTLQECAAWHQTPEVAVRWANVPELVEALT